MVVVRLRHKRSSPVPGYGTDLGADLQLVDAVRSLCTWLQSPGSNYESPGTTTRCSSTNDACASDTNYDYEQPRKSAEDSSVAHRGQRLLIDSKIKCGAVGKGAALESDPSANSSTNDAGNLEPNAQNPCRTVTLTAVFRLKRSGYFSWSTEHRNKLRC